MADTDISIKQNTFLFCYLFLFISFFIYVPSMLWCCLLGGRKGIRPVKNWVVGCWCGYVSGSRCRLHMAQLMPLSLTISCSSKFRLVLPSWILPLWYWLTRAVPDKIQKSHKTIVCVVCVFISAKSGRYTVFTFVCLSVCVHSFEGAEWHVVCWETYSTRAWKVENISIRTIYDWNLCFIGFLMT